MIINRFHLAVAAVTATALVVAGASSASAAQPSSVGTQQTAASSTAPGRVYLGTFFDNANHNYLVDVAAGSYVVEYDWTYGGGVNTFIDASQPNGSYLGQVGGGYQQMTDTREFTLTAGAHRITSQSPELRGPVTVYLDPA